MAEKDAIDEKAPDDVFSSVDINTLAPELQTIYKGFQGDYTRKTQDLATRRKEFEAKETEFESKLVGSGELKQEVKQWRDWYASLEDSESGKTEQNQQTLTTDTTTNYLDEPGLEPVKKYLSEFEATKGKELTALKATVEQLQSVIKDTTDQTSKMFSYHAQLNDLAGQHKDLDKQKLLDFALENGHLDLTKAYNTLYQDDIIADRVKQGVEEELKKQRTQGIRGTGQQVIVRQGKDTPKTFEEATQSILDERATLGI